MKTGSDLLVCVLCLGFLSLPKNVSCAQDPSDIKSRQAYMRKILDETPASGTTVSSPGAVSSVVSVNDLSVSADARKEFEKGRDLFLNQHKVPDSIDSLNKAIRIAPSFSKAYYLLGLVHMSVHKWSDAEPVLRKATSLDAKFGIAYLTLGSCLFEQEKYAEAEEPLLRGVELSPEVSGGHYDLARTYYAVNRFQDAEAQARRAVALAPEFPDSHVVLGYALLRLQKNNDALDELLTYLRLSPDGPFAPATRTVVNQLGQVQAARH